MNKQRVKALLIGFGIILIIILGYHLYLQYQQDIHLFIDPRASKEKFVHEIQSHGALSAFLLIGLTTIMCAVP